MISFKDILRHTCTLQVTITIAVLVGTGNTHAQDAQVDWPCIQRLVPEVSAAVIWPGPMPETLNQNWRNHAATKTLVTQLISRSTSPDQYESLIETYVNALPVDEQDLYLTMAFSGVLEELNRRRADYIQTIKRFTRHQNAVAGQVEDLLNELAALTDSNESGTESKRLELQETVRWHQRVFDQREKAFVSLCEQPVKVEETLGELARSIAYFLN